MSALHRRGRSALSPKSNGCTSKRRHAARGRAAYARALLHRGRLEQHLLIQHLLIKGGHMPPTALPSTSRSSACHYGRVLSTAVAWKQQTRIGNVLLSLCSREREGSPDRFCRGGRQDANAPVRCPNISHTWRWNGGQSGQIPGPFPIKPAAPRIVWMRRGPPCEAAGRYAAQSSRASMR